MFKSLLCFLLLAAAPQADVFKKEMSPLQSAIDSAISTTGAQLMGHTKAAYIAGYGIVVMSEISLEPPRNPFSSAKTSSEVKGAMDRRLKDVKAKMADLLTQRIAKTDSIGDTESIAIVIYVMSTNPADAPDLPAQVTFSARKQAPAQVTIGEY